ncbi:MAG: PEP-CTERM sorting domain-containing protein [Akkermansiaceae bacterium]|nr:PEP-CTERM sorting domain-containing protein [Akkermansiaceae bacterium]
MKQILTLITSALAVGGAQAAIIATDNASTAPTLGGNVIGYNGAASARFGWDASESFTQSFTVSGAGTLDTIYLGYNAFDNGETLTFDLSVNGNLVETGIILDGDNFSGSSGTDGGSTPVYWMKLDLSAENIPVSAGSNNFTMAATSDTGAGYALAPLYNSNTSSYTGGAMNLSFSVTTGDLLFAVATTPVPEPSSSALLGLGGLALILRRRKG